MQTEEQISALTDAMDQLLDDMGPKGQSVCLAAKAQARIAFEPFLDPECVEFVMPLSEAQSIVADIERSR
jgi:hypothetical protein